MTSIERTGQFRDFALWLRTGRLPTVDDDGVELKFNPWHDADDGQFTHAGAGRYFGPNGGQSPARRANDRPRMRASGKPAAKPSSGPLRKVAEFTGGVAEGARDAVKQTATALYEAATTNPVTTVRNFGEGVAQTIDGAIAAENTPARVQARRAADAIANASPRELGYGTGQVAANAALAAAPGAAATRIASVRRVATARPRETFDLPEVGWAKENLGEDSLAKRYNDSAPGARPGQAPVLMQTMPDGSKRPVKFDGIAADTPIDRKLRIVDAPRARAQTLRQSEVLAQHRLVGTWEVPNVQERNAAYKLFKKLKVTNIRVRIVKP